MSRKFLFTFLMLLLIFLGMRAQARPMTSLRIATSPYAGYRKWIEAQARHESDNYTSRLAIDHKNIFGMGFPIWRNAVNVGHTKPTFDGGQIKSKYKSFDQSIQDFLLYLEYENFPTNFKTIEGYVKQMEMNGYFEDTYDNYLNALKRWL